MNDTAVIPEVSKVIAELFRQTFLMEGRWKETEYELHCAYQSLHRAHIENRELRSRLQTRDATMERLLCEWNPPKSTRLFQSPV